MIYFPQSRGKEWRRILVDSPSSHDRSIIKVPPMEGGTMNSNLIFKKDLFYPAGPGGRTHG